MLVQPCSIRLFKLTSVLAEYAYQTILKAHEPADEPESPTALYLHTLLKFHVNHGCLCRSQEKLLDVPSWTITDTFP